MASTIKFTSKFEDESTRTISLGSFDTDKIPEDLKEKVKNFNDPTKRAQSYPSFDNAFISDNGAKFKEITEVQIVTSERTYYY